MNDLPLQPARTPGAVPGLPGPPSPPPGTLAFPSRPFAGPGGPPPSGGEAEVVPLRPREKVKRLKSPLWIRLLRPLAAALLIVGLPAMTVVWLLSSPSFALREARFSPASQSRRVPTAWVERTLHAFDGRNIWQLPLDDVETALRRHPWVAAVGLRKAPPRTLVISIVEKSEVALYRRGGELDFIDRDGRLIDRYDPRGGGADLPILSGGDPALALPAAMSLLGELEKAQPTWSAGLSELEILGGEDFRLFTAELPFPVLVRAGTLGDKTPRLQALLPQIQDRYSEVKAVDLRFARRIIVQPVENAAVKAGAPAGAKPATVQALGTPAKPPAATS